MRVSKGLFGGIKEIYCSQQFKIIFEKTTYERSAKYPQSWGFFYFFQAVRTLFLLATTDYH